MFRKRMRSIWPTRHRSTRCERKWSGNIKTKKRFGIQNKFQFKILKHVEDLETQLKNTEDRIEKLQSDLNMHQFFAESIDQPDRTDSVVARLEKDSQECRLNIDRIHSQLKELSQRSGTSEQIIMWRSLIQIFEKKIELIRRRYSCASAI